MTFGEKLRETRIAHNLSQSELAEMTGLSERSLYTYEQLDVIPRKNNLRKLAVLGRVRYWEVESRKDSRQGLSLAYEEAGKLWRGGLRV